MKSSLCLLLTLFMANVEILSGSEHGTTCNYRTPIACKSDGKCIPSSWKCDGYSDCEDNSDEADCQSVVCTNYEFKCRDGFGCILNSWVCDGVRDCVDGSDEDSVTCTDRSCPREMILCNNTGQCVSAGWKCDGYKDCIDGEDEVSCGLYTCDTEEFKCVSENKCITKAWTCDGDSDCTDGSDEWQCRGITNVDECLEEGVCSNHGCRNTGGSYTCQCHPGYESYHDDHLARQVCKAVDAADAKLLFASSPDIREILLSQPSNMTVVQSTRNPVTLDFDYKQQRVYWTDKTHGTIYSSLMYDDQTDVVLEGISTPEGLALDWVHQNIYWTDPEHDAIMISSLRGSSRLPFTLLSSGLDAPRSLAVDPRDSLRKLYFSDWGNQPKIEEVLLDGSVSTRRILLQNQDKIYWPNGLTIDYEINRLYFVDAKLDHLASIDLAHDNNFSIVFSSHRQLGHPFAITIFEDMLFWTDWYTRSLYKINKFNASSDTTTVATGLYTPMELFVFHTLRQPEATDACGSNNGGCSHICLPTKDSYVCECPDLFSKDPANDKNCIEATP